MTIEQTGEKLPGLEDKETNYSSLVLCSASDYDAIPADKAFYLDKYLLKSINNVPFYAGYAERHAGITHSNLYQFPLTLQEDLLQNPYQLVSSDSQIAQLTSSGGTYGKRKLLFRTSNDTEKR